MEILGEVRGPAFGLRSMNEEVSGRRSAPLGGEVEVVEGVFRGRICMRCSDKPTA